MGSTRSPRRLIVNADDYGLSRGVNAMSGLVIWVLAAPRAGWRTALFVIVYSLVTLIGADVTPQIIKRGLSPAARFAIPLTFAWLAIVRDLLRRGPPNTWAAAGPGEMLPSSGSMIAPSVSPQSGRA